MGPRRLLTAIVLAAWTSGAGGPASAADIESFRVLALEGSVEVQSAAGAWKPAAAQAVLRKADRLRTGAGSWAQLAFDRDLHGGARLGPQSQLRLVSVVPPRLALEKGTLLVHRSGESDGLSDPPDRRSISPAPLTIEAGALEVGVRWGGAGVELAASGPLVRVYDERAQIARRSGEEPLTVHEGFRYEAARKGPGALFRMEYSDYLDWQDWMRRLYELKDDLAYERREAALSS